MAVQKEGLWGKAKGGERRKDVVRGKMEERVGIRRKPLDDCTCAVVYSAVQCGSTDWRCMYMRCGSERGEVKGGSWRESG